MVRVRALVSLTLIALSLPAPGRAEAPRVHLQIAADADESRALADVMRELVQRLPAELVFDPTGDDELAGPDPRGYVARITIDMREPGSALLFVHDPAQDRMLVRRVARVGNSEELVREELGHIAQTAIEALIAGATVGVPREEALRALSAEQERARQATAEQPPAQSAAAPPSPAPQPERRREERVRDRFQLRGAVFYEVGLLGHEPGVAHGPALAALLRSPWLLRAGAIASAQYRFPFAVDSEPVGMREQVFALRVLATIEPELSSAFALRFGLGGGADIVRLEPQLAASAVASARVTAERTLVLAVARALAGIDFHMSRLLSLWIAVAADIDLDKSQYVLVDEDGAERTLSEPWRVRPSLLVGVALP